MTKAETKEMTVLDEFLHQREKRQNTNGLEAKKLVTLYRQLSLFGPDFLETYNQMLLASTPEVQAAMPDIIGGTVVRQYLDFLKMKNSDSPDEDAEKTIYSYEGGYLPTPEEVGTYRFAPHISAGSVDATPVTDTSTQAAFFADLLAQQNKFFADMLQGLKDELAKSATRGHTETSQELLSAGQETQQALLDIVNKQSALFNENLQKILCENRELADKQMKLFSKALKDKTTALAYNVIEPETEVSVVTPEYSLDNE